MILLMNIKSEKQKPNCLCQYRKAMVTGRSRKSEGVGDRNDEQEHGSQVRLAAATD